jgi:Fe-Mn family superoxide dismutase
MASIDVYKPRQFNLSNLKGISDETLEMHFKLYEGYVKETNKLNEKISEFVKGGKVDQDEFAEYSELNRRLGFEYNGMVLHEYYFDNLKTGGGTGKMRGVGWAICYQNPMNGALSNHWITLHETGNVAGFTPVLVMDVWEHAFILDYKPADRPKYIEAFFANIDWAIVERRLKQQKVQTLAA